MSLSKAGFASALLAAWMLAACGNSFRASSEPPRVVAYVAGWSVPIDIPVRKLTHINFAFADINAYGEAGLFKPGYDEQLASLLSLRSANPDLKFLVSVGGWGAEGFSDAALTADSRARFAASIVKLVQWERIDGVDLDWEYPGQGAAGIRFRSEDKRNFTLLLEAVRTALDAASAEDGRLGGDRYLLTIATADREYFEHTEMNLVQAYVDWINVMAYDFFNSLTSTTGHHAGLFASEFAAAGDRNVDASIRQHLAAGIPPEKLVLGVPFYGRRFEGVDPLHDGLNRPYSRYGGDHGYAELVKSFIGREGFERRWDAKARAPFLWNGATGSFITYEDPESLRAKMAYAREKHLGGVMFWELSQDPDGALLEAIRVAWP
jgi:chitinase